MVEIEGHLYAHLCGWQVAKISDGARGFFGVCFLLESAAFKLNLRVLNLSQSHRFCRAHQKFEQTTSSEVHRSESQMASHSQKMAILVKNL